MKALLIFLMLWQSSAVTEYDRFRDITKTSVTIRNLQTSTELLTMVCEYQFTGKSYSKPSHIACSFLRVGDDLLFTSGSEVIFIAGSERLRFAAAQTVTTVTTQRIRLAEILKTEVPVTDFLRIAKAEKLDYLISGKGDTKGTLSEAEMLSLRALAETIQ